MNRPGESSEDEQNTHLTPEEVWKLIRSHISGCTAFAVKNLDPLQYLGPQVSTADYMAFCAQYLKKEPVLTPELLRQRVDQINDEARLKLLFPAGKRCCLAVIPVNYYGNELEDKEKEKGEFLVDLIVTLSDDEDENGLTERFGSGPSYIYNILPKEVRETCSFTIPEYEDPNPNVVTDTDRMTICKLYEEAYRNSQKLFNKEAPEVPTLS